MAFMPAHGVVDVRNDDENILDLFSEHIPLVYGLIHRFYDHSALFRLGLIDNSVFGGARKPVEVIYYDMVIFRVCKNLSNHVEEQFPRLRSRLVHPSEIFLYLYIVPPTVFLTSRHLRRNGGIMLELVCARYSCPYCRDLFGLCQLHALCYDLLFRRQLHFPILYHGCYLFLNYYSYKLRNLSLQSRPIPNRLQAFHLLVVSLTYEIQI